MEFFKPLVEVAGKFEKLTLIIAPVGDTISVSVLPGTNNKDVNEKLVQFAATILWNMFRKLRIENNGCFLNLETMSVNPIKVRA